MRIRRPSARSRAIGRVVGVRLMRLAVTLLIISLLTFLLLSLVPGDPAISILGFLYATPANIARLHRELGLNQPLPERYLTWLWHVLHGNWGQSYDLHESVMSAIGSHLPVTAELVVVAELLAIVIATLVAVLSAEYNGSLFDRFASVTSFGLIAVPSFVLGIFLIFLVAVKTNGLLAATGFVPLSQGLGPNMRSLVLPALTLAAPSGAVYARVLRSELLNTLRQDYLTFAAAKGLSRMRIMFRHALRPSSLPVVTLIGIDFGVLIGGAFVVEQLFSLPGIGDLLIQSIYRKDYLLVQGIVLLITLIYVVINFGVDVIYGIIDPRVRLGDARA